MVSAIKESANDVGKQGRRGSWVQLLLSRTVRLVNQLINMFDVLGGNWGPTDKKFTSMNFIQTRFAFYMQSVPSGNHHMYAPLWVNCFVVHC